MREVALTLAEVGLQPARASATANRHDALAQQMADAGLPHPAGKFAWRALADALAAAEATGGTGP
jgi:hypothetical protein